MITQAQLIAELAALVEASKTQKKAAEKLGICENYISQILVGNANPGPAVYEGMGYRRVVMYEKVEDAR